MGFYTAAVKRKVFYVVLSIGIVTVNSVPLFSLDTKLMVPL